MACGTATSPAPVASSPQAPQASPGPTQALRLTLPLRGEMHSPPRPRPSSTAAPPRLTLKLPPSTAMDGTEQGGRPGKESEQSSSTER